MISYNNQRFRETELKKNNEKKKKKKYEIRKKELFGIFFFSLEENMHLIGCCALAGLCDAVVRRTKARRAQR
jgi:hypothetical protein